MKNGVSNVFLFCGLSVSVLLAGCRGPVSDVASLRVAPGGAIDSLAKALDEVLRLRASGAVAKERQIVVDIACGTYAVARPLEITSEHGPLLLRGAGPLGTVLSGGKRLGQFRRELDGLTWRNAIDKGLDFDQLFINGRRADLSPVANRFDPRAPGAWYLDTATHEIVYVARKGESPFGTIAIAGTVEAILCLNGASDISIEGVTFMHNALGHEGGLGAIVISAGSKRISFVDCKFEHCANYGLKVVGSADVTIRHSWFEDAGSGALLGAGTRRILFEDTVVVGCGDDKAGHAVVALTSVEDARVFQNDFCNLKGNGVKADASIEAGKNRFWKVSGEVDSPRTGDDGVRSTDPSWRARVEMLTF